MLHDGLQSLDRKTLQVRIPVGIITLCNQLSPAVAAGQVIRTALTRFEQALCGGQLILPQQWSKYQAIYERVTKDAKCTIVQLEARQFEAIDTIIGIEIETAYRGVLQKLTRLEGSKVIYNRRVAIVVALAYCLDTDRKL